MIDAQKMVDLLNDALKTDPASMTLLFSVRRACNKALADHPFIQVLGEEEGPFNVGFLGLLNGILGSDGSKNLVAAILDDGENQNVIGFKVLECGADPITAP